MSADPRERARQVAGQGVCLLVHAVNAAGRPDAGYRYADQEHFKRLMIEVLAFIERGEIETVTAPTAAESDGAFQRFMEGLASGSGVKS